MRIKNYGQYIEAPYPSLFRVFFVSKLTCSVKITLFIPVAFHFATLPSVRLTNYSNVDTFLRAFVVCVDGHACVFPLILRFLYSLYCQGTVYDLLKVV